MVSEETLTLDRLNDPRSRSNVQDKGRRDAEPFKINRRIVNLSYLISEMDKTGFSSIEKNVFMSCLHHGKQKSYPTAFAESLAYILVRNGGEAVTVSGIVQYRLSTSQSSSSDQPLPPPLPRPPSTISILCMPNPEPEVYLSKGISACDRKVKDPENLKYSMGDALKMVQNLPLNLNDMTLFMLQHVAPAAVLRRKINFELPFRAHVYLIVRILSEMVRSKRDRVQRVRLGNLLRFYIMIASLDHQRESYIDALQIIQDHPLPVPPVGFTFEPVCLELSKNETQKLSEVSQELLRRPLSEKVWKSLEIGLMTEDVYLLTKDLLITSITQTLESINRLEKVAHVISFEDLQYVVQCVGNHQDVLVAVEPMFDSFGLMLDNYWDDMESIDKFSREDKEQESREVVEKRTALLIDRIRDVAVQHDSCKHLRNVLIGQNPLNNNFLELDDPEVINIFISHQSENPSSRWNLDQWTCTLRSTCISVKHQILVDKLEYIVEKLVIDHPFLRLLREWNEKKSMSIETVPHGETITLSDVISRFPSETPSLKEQFHETLARPHRGIPLAADSMNCCRVCTFFFDATLRHHQIVVDTSRYIPNHSHRTLPTHLPKGFSIPVGQAVVSELEALLWIKLLEESSQIEEWYQMTLEEVEKRKRPIQLAYSNSSPPIFSEDSKTGGERGHPSDNYVAPFKRVRFE